MKISNLENYKAWAGKKANGNNFESVDDDTNTGENFVRKSRQPTQIKVPFDPNVFSKSTPTSIAENSTSKRRNENTSKDRDLISNAMQSSPRKTPAPKDLSSVADNDESRRSSASSSTQERTDRKLVSTTNEFVSEKKGTKEKASEIKNENIFAEEIVKLLHDVEVFVHGNEKWIATITPSTSSSSSSNSLSRGDAMDRDSYQDHDNTKQKMINLIKSLEAKKSKGLKEAEQEKMSSGSAVEEWLPLWKHRQQGVLYPLSRNVLKGKSLWCAVARAVVVMVLRPLLSIKRRRERKRHQEQQDMQQTMSLCLEACADWMGKVVAIPFLSIAQVVTSLTLTHSLTHSLTHQSFSQVIS